MNDTLDIIPADESNKIWDRFYKDFSFNPSVLPADWPSIKTEEPNIKINIADLLGHEYSEAKWAALIKKGISCFTRISNPQDEIIVLDWQHECFYINPRQITVDGMLPNESTTDSIPSFIPDGDYYIFLTKDFQNVWFGHPWEKTITIIGHKLIKAYQETL